MSSPFQFGKTVTGTAFTNRKKQLKMLVDNLSSGISTILISPRRWGKSSLVKKCIEESFSKDKDYKIVMLDLFKIRNEEEFLETYATETIKCSIGKATETVLGIKELFKTIVPKISFSADSVSNFSISFDRQNIKSNRQEILDLPQRIAKKRKIKIIFCIDEFQNILNYNNSGLIIKELRSSWQNHQDVTYCLYGSKRHMMSGIFNDSNSPFYRFGSIIFLDKIEKKNWITFISDAFQRTGKEIDQIFCEEIADTMGNHPFYVQQLSHIVWNLTIKSVNKDIMNEALDRIIDMNRPFFIREFESLSNSQINLLKAISRNETSYNSSENLAKYKLGTSGNVSKNKKILRMRDIIEIDGLQISFLDPVFEEWFKQTVF